MDAYKSREPSPYWPDSGNSQMTCNVAPVTLGLTSVAGTAVEGSAGMVKKSIVQYNDTKVEAVELPQQRNEPDTLASGTLLLLGGLLGLKAPASLRGGILRHRKKKVPKRRSRDHEVIDFSRSKDTHGPDDRGI
jgi:hypothetical protein